MQTLVNELAARGWPVRLRGPLAVLPAFNDGRMRWPAVWFRQCGPLIICWRFRLGAGRRKQCRLFWSPAKAATWGTEI